MTNKPSEPKYPDMQAPTSAGGPGRDTDGTSDAADAALLELYFRLGPLGRLLGCYLTRVMGE